MKRLIFLSTLIATLVVGCATTEEFPNNAEALISLGDNAFQRGKFDKAAKVYERFTLMFPTDPKAPYAQFMLAESYFKNKDWTEAISEYKFLLDNYPQNPYREVAQFHMATAYFRKSPPPYLDQTETEKALSMLREFLSRFPNSKYAPEARKVVEEAKDKLAKHMLIAADTYIKLGKYESAKIYLEELIRNYPNVPTSWRARVLLGKILIKLGEPDRALATLDEIIQNPSIPDSLKRTASNLRETIQ